MTTRKLLSICMTAVVVALAVGCEKSMVTEDEAIAAVQETLGPKWGDKGFDAELDDAPDDLDLEGDSFWVVKSSDGRYVAWVDIETGEVLDALIEFGSGGKMRATKGSSPR